MATMPAEPRISIVMPAFNAALHLDGVLDRIGPALWGKIVSLWIINDGSRDDTGAVADRAARKNSKIKPVHLSANSGYGEAVRSGLLRCREEDCNIVFCLHADGQYPPEVILDFAGFMQEKDVDLLQGSRIASGTALSGGMPLYKYVANRCLTFCENRVFSLHLSDFHSGFLGYSRRALLNAPIERLSRSFDFDVEVIACCRALGYKISERSVPAHYGDEISHVQSVRYGIRICRVMIRYLRGVYTGYCRNGGRA
jgi:glycosyltransferase involved in cell wall biosynthesis